MVSQEHTLISPLGLSPGAVSGVAFGLSRGVGESQQSYPISRVVTVGTESVRKSANCLAPLFADAGIEYIPLFIAQDELKQTDKSVPDFITRLGTVFETYKESTIHVAVTGGRSGMGALAALAASLYGADYLWHLWVPTTIEEKGHIDKLPQPYKASNEFLNPPEYELVSLPFVNLGPLHTIFWQYYRSEKLSASVTENVQLEAMLSHMLTGEMQLADVYPGGISLREKQFVEQQFADYQTASATEKGKRQGAIVRLLYRAGVVDKAKQTELLDLLELEYPLPDLINLAQETQTVHALWPYLLENKMRVESAVRFGKRPLANDDLLNKLRQAFNKEEFRTLCFCLNVDYDDLGGEGKVDQMRELVLNLERRNRLPELAALADSERQDTQWWSPPEYDEVAADLFLFRGLLMWLNQRDGT